LSNVDIVQKLTFITLLVDTGLFQDKKLSSELKRDIIDKLFYFYDWGNFGMEDLLLDTVYSVCETKADWEYMIEKLSKIKGGYRQDLI